MKHTYTITGMQCETCAGSIRERLSEIPQVSRVDVDLESSRAEISMQEHVPLPILQTALPNKYTIAEMSGQNNGSVQGEATEKSKLRQLGPLFLIFFYLLAACFLLNYSDWDSKEAMLDFMGLFYIVFSFFKLLDLKGFPDSFRMYDPLAKAIPAYGWAYPFLEVVLGLLLLMRFQVAVALVATVVILGITTFGVTKTLLDKKSIRCACLGTALKLPMTEATFIENAIMLVMALIMLAQHYF